MKELMVLLLMMFPLWGYSQSLLNALESHKENLAVSTSNNEVSPKDVIASQGATISSSAEKCAQNDQASMPLKYLLSLLMEKNPKLDISHNSRTGDLKISFPGMIGNCSSMLRWQLKKPTIQGSSAYALEVKFSESKDFFKMQSGRPVLTTREKPFGPTLAGFEECLKESGVIVENKVNSEAIYKAPLNEKFSGIDKSGKLLFLSSGPSSSQTGVKYGENFQHVDGCDHYELAHPQIASLLTVEDAQKEKLDAEAEKLKECSVDEYEKLADFISTYEDYALELGDVRDSLILKAAEKAASAIEKGNYSQDDLKVIDDFEKYVINPKAKEAAKLYEEMLSLEGDARLRKEEELKKVRDELKALDSKPYFLASHTLKLVQDGKFSEAEKLNDAKLVLKHFKNLGRKISNVVITPEVASNRVADGKDAFSEALVVEREKYEYRTGQSSGKYDYYSDLASRMGKNIEIRTQNFHDEIRREIERAKQPNGYCYRYWRNTQKCIQETLERVKELQALLKHYNEVDYARAQEYQEKADYYAELESEGERYLAAEEGLEVEEAPPAPQAVITSSVTPPRRAEVSDTSTYAFDFSQSSGQQVYQQAAQFMPQQYQQPLYGNVNNNMFTQQNPYGYQQGQLGMQSYPTMNQFSNGPQGLYNFNWQGQAGGQFGQYQQQGFWNNPTQAYNQYSVYGSLW